MKYVHIPVNVCLWQHTHEPNVHQLIVKVDGWKQVQPVSVDKVGVYFRHAAADIDSTSKLVCMSVYVVFFHYVLLQQFKCYRHHVTSDARSVSYLLHCSRNLM